MFQSTLVYLLGDVYDEKCNKKLRNYIVFEQSANYFLAVVTNLSKGMYLPVRCGVLSEIAID